MYCMYIKGDGHFQAYRCFQEHLCDVQCTMKYNEAHSVLNNPVRYCQDERMQKKVSLNLFC